MKKIIVFIFLLTALTFAQQEFQHEHIQSADKIDNLYIECSTGRIYCEPSETQKIEIYVKKIIYLDDEEEAKELADACKVKFKEDRGTLEVIIDMPRRSYSKRGLFEKIFDGNFNDDLEIMIKALVPPDVDIEIETSSADIYATKLTNNDIEINGSSSDISIEEVKGDCYADVSSGDLEAFRVEGNIDFSGSSSDFDLEDITGNIRVSTSSGDGMIERAKGELDFKTSSGDIKVFNLEGDLYFRSTSGDIIAENITGLIGAATTSGTISLKRLTNEQGKFRAESTSGDVHLEISSAFEGELELETTSGDIDSRLDISINRYSRNYVTGSIGSGNGEINIETSSGDIILETY